MAQPYRFSPTLLVVTLLAVIAGAGAGLLGVGSPAAPPISINGHWSVGIPVFAVEAVMLLPLVALAAVYLVSLSGSGAGGGGSGSGSGTRGLAVGLVVVLLLTLGLLLIVIHPAPLAPLENIGRASGGGGGDGGGSGSGPSHHGGGNGTNGTGGTNGTNGTSPPGGNSSNNSSSGGGGGGSGPNGSKNGTNGTGGGGGGNGGNGGGHLNNSTALITGSSSPGLPQWLTFAAVGLVAAVLLGIVVPRFTAQPKRRKSGPLTATGADARAAAAAAFSAADLALASDADPRHAIGQLYRRLVSQVAPVIDGPLHETPEEVRDLHLLPMGVRPVAAQHLTHLFEEASYSSHALGTDDVARARQAIQLAELDLRSSRSAG